MLNREVVPLPESRARAKGLKQTLEGAHPQRPKRRGMVRHRVIFRGRVQGVYFRDTVRQIAERYAVSGFVRNVAHDLVEVQAEGAADVVAAFVADVVAHPSPAAIIDNIETSDEAPTGDPGFSVQRSIGR